MQIDFVNVMKKQEDGSLIWVEAVQNVETARKRIDTFRNTAPGEYAIFDQTRQQIVGYVVADPFKSRQRRLRKDSGEA
jgi:hypothetical protein